MLKAWLAFYARQCAHYPARWYWPIVRIFGGPAQDTCYMTRGILTPPTRRGQLYLHVFHREDLDRDPHDHPFDFWTLPLNKGYIEDVYSEGSECFLRVHVPRWRWSFRPAEHCHRVVETDDGRWPLVTLVWRGPSKRRWGFWVHTREALDATKRRWVLWKDYIFGGESANANLPGRDVNCPGATRRE